MLLNINLGVATDDVGVGKNILALIAVDPALNIVSYAEFFALLLFFIVIQSRKWLVGMHHKLSVALFSMVFALLWVVGYSCSVFSTPHAVFDGFLNAAASMVFSIAVACLAYFSIQLLFCCLDARFEEARIGSERRGFSAAIERSSHGLSRMTRSFLDKLYSRPMLIGSLTYIALWGMLLLLYYPGMFAPGDTLNQIMQFYGNHEPTSNAIVLLDSGVTLNTHHPVFHTVLMGTFVWLGQTLFASANFGYFAYVLIQLVCVALTLGYVLAFCCRKGVDGRITVVLYLFFAVFPWFSEYAILGTKDTLFACALLLTCLSVFQLLTSEGLEKADWVVLFVGVIGFCMLRKGYAIVAVALAMLLGLVFRGRGSVVKASCAMGAIGVIAMLVSAFVFPTLHISSGSPREALSVPMQQVARCVVAHGDDISDEQKAAMAGVLDYERIPALYDPVLSDPVKNTFNKYATTDNMMDFLKVWLQLLGQYPETCAAATAMNYYRWFYPSGFPTTYAEYNSGNPPMSSSDIHAELIGVDHPVLESGSMEGGLARSISKMYGFYQEAWAEAPLLSMTAQAPTYVWLLLLSMLYLATRRRNVLYAFLPIFFVLVVTLIGPCNFVVRYLFPLMFALVPMVILAFWSPAKTDFGRC